MPSIIFTISGIENEDKYEFLRVVMSMAWHKIALNGSNIRTKI